MPADTNSAGDIFGGWLLAQMDLAAGACALQVARGRVATARAYRHFGLSRPGGPENDRRGCYCRDTQRQDLL